MQKTPNSWASVDLRGRLFGSKEEEEAEDQNDHSVESNCEEDVAVHDVAGVGPVTTPQLVQARQDFSREYWRDILMQGTTRLFASSNVQNSQEIAQFSDVPSSTAGDDSYRYLPQ